MKPLIIDNFLSPQDCAALIETGRKYPRENSGIQSKMVRRWKKTSDIVSTPETDLYYRLQKIHTSVGDKIKQAYNVSGSVVPRDVGYFYEYRMGDFYLPHVDSQTVYCRDGEETLAVRKSSSSDISSILYLNDNFVGGELEFILPKYKIAPKTGRLLLFYGGWQNAHQVNTIELGFRYCVVNWYKTDPVIVPNMETVPEPYAEIFADLQKQYTRVAKLD